MCLCLELTLLLCAMQVVSVWQHFKDSQNEMKAFVSPLFHPLGDKVVDVIHANIYETYS